ncbi:MULTISPECIES: endolytic transglycosylase MltG [Acetobacter]|nr:endolytic transglycosylase MltG [Acetobacter lovaniensis]MCI1697511.1 endolytic transglycosylase MltG [Acetobacter lovaniensis]MCP1238609.1 endolytic transglycosylase MltG [Acetobacter lovaniensis]NHN79956.1 endolytic transglycosylase MltG [Acetobacter lovaniensis]
MASKRKKTSSPPSDRSKLSSFLKWSGGGVFVLVAGMGLTAFSGWQSYTSPGPLSTDQDIVVPHGNYATTLSALQNAGVVPTNWWSSRVFSIALVLTRRDGQLHAAELHFPAYASIEQTLWILRHGKPVQHKLTIPEGLTAWQIQTLIQAAPLLTGDTPLPEEGSTLPQTYTYLRNSSRKDLLVHMQTSMAQTLKQVWAERESGLPLSNPQELLTLASVIEKETAQPDERPSVARVFYNRLQKNMKLQTDPTVIYAITQGKPPLDRPLTHTDLQTVSPYNTYVYTGLPPGPICSPGKAALEAAAHPAKGDMLYFVANGTGGHNFAATLGDHNHNVLLLRKQKTSH